MSIAPGGEAIEAVLPEIAQGIALAWVAGLRDQLRREGRRMTGGWPGTIAEAKLHAMRKLPGELERRGLGPPLAAHYDKTSKTLYAAARKAWLVDADPGD